MAAARAPGRRGPSTPGAQAASRARCRAQGPARALCLGPELRDGAVARPRPPPAPAQGGRAGPTFTRGIKFFALTHMLTQPFSLGSFISSAAASPRSGLVLILSRGQVGISPRLGNIRCPSQVPTAPAPHSPLRRSLMTLSQLMSLTALWPPCGPARLCWARSRSPSQSDLPAPKGDRRLRPGPGRGPSSSPYLHRSVG